MSDTKITMRESMELFHKLLTGEVTPRQAAEQSGNPVERVAIYRRFVDNHLRAILEKNFVVLCQLLSGPVWDRLVKEYFISHPPRAFEINANAERFPAFLESLVQENDPDINEFHVELAELEWREWQVYASTEDMPQAGELEIPVLNPTLTILDFEHPVLSFAMMWREAVRTKTLPPAVPKPHKELVFVLRHPETLNAVAHIVDDELLFAFKVVYEEMSIPRAAQESGASVTRIQQVLNRAAGAGVVILPED